MAEALWGWGHPLDPLPERARGGAGGGGGPPPPKAPGCSAWALREPLSLSWSHFRRERSSEPGRRSGGSSGGGSPHPPPAEVSTAPSPPRSVLSDGG